MKEIKSISIPDLINGGIILTYLCTIACIHCLYRCTPQMLTEWMSFNMLEKIMDKLSEEKHLKGLHLSGGEVTLNKPLVIEIIRRMIKRNLPLEFIETNAGWATSREKAYNVFREMKDAGLPGIWISVSPFHNASIPLYRTKTAIDAAIDVFGDKNTIIFKESIIELLEKMDDRVPHSFDEFMAVNGFTDIESLTAYHNITLNGRACENFRSYYDSHPARYFSKHKCSEKLLDTSHFHMDLHGNLITGCCPGISAGSVDNPHPVITPDRYPVFYRLVESGPYGLLMWALRENIIEWDNDQLFVSACDLCIHLRNKLLGSAFNFNELKPAEYYSWM